MKSWWISPCGLCHFGSPCQIKFMTYSFESDKKKWPHFIKSLSLHQWLPALKIFDSRWPRLRLVCLALRLIRLFRLLNHLLKLVFMALNFVRRRFESDRFVLFWPPFLRLCPACTFPVADFMFLDNYHGHPSSPYYHDKLFTANLLQMGVRTSGENKGLHARRCISG